MLAAFGAYSVPSGRRGCLSTLRQDYRPDLPALEARSGWKQIGGEKVQSGDVLRKLGEVDRELIERRVRLFCEWLALSRNSSLDTASEADLTAYSVVRQKDKSTSSNRRLSVFRRYYAWAVREHRAQVDPTLRIRSAKQPARFPATLSEAQVEALLGAPDVDTPLGLRDRTMLELMYASGLRVTELVTLKTVEVGLNEGVVRVMGKGAKWPTARASSRLSGARNLPMARLISISQVVAALTQTNG